MEVSSRPHTDKRLHKVPSSLETIANLIGSGARSSSVSPWIVVCDGNFVAERQQEDTNGTPLLSPNYFIHLPAS